MRSLPSFASDGDATRPTEPRSRHSDGEARSAGEWPRHRDEGCSTSTLAGRPTTAATRAARARSRRPLARHAPATAVGVMWVPSLRRGAQAQRTTFENAAASASTRTTTTTAGRQDGTSTRGARATARQRTRDRQAEGGAPRRPLLAQESSTWRRRARRARARAREGREPRAHRPVGSRRARRQRATTARRCEVVGNVIETIGTQLASSAGRTARPIRDCAATRSPRALGDPHALREHRRSLRFDAQHDRAQPRTGRGQSDEGLRRHLRRRYASARRDGTNRPTRHNCVRDASAS